jgi:hypothetical protein
MMPETGPPLPTWRFTNVVGYLRYCGVDGRAATIAFLTEAELEMTRPIRYY